MTQKKSKSTALTTIRSRFPVLSSDNEMMLQALEENLKGEQISPFDFDRVTVPTGGSPVWIVPSIEKPEGVAVDNIEGIVIHQSLGRSFWRESLDDSGGGSPPDCFSNDSLVGQGDPAPGRAEPVEGRGDYTYDCDTCSNAQWGSDDKQRGQACKQTRILFVLRPDQALPTVIAVPPSSLTAVKKFLLRLASEGRPYWSVVTSFGLEPTKNVDGVKFSKILPSVAGLLEEKDILGVREYISKVRPALENVPIVESRA